MWNLNSSFSQSNTFFCVDVNFMVKARKRWSYRGKRNFKENGMEKIWLKLVVPLVPMILWWWCGGGGKKICMTDINAIRLVFSRWVEKYVGSVTRSAENTFKKCLKCCFSFSVLPFASFFLSHILWFGIDSKKKSSMKNIKWWLVLQMQF